MNIQRCSALSVGLILLSIFTYPASGRRTFWQKAEKNNIILAVSDPVSDPCSEVFDGNEYNLSLHIASIFIILATSGLGAFIPVISTHYTRFKVPDNVITFGKHFGTGVILATGFIHMLPSAMANLTSPCLGPEFSIEYTAYAPLFAMLAALFMQLIEQLASEHGERRRRQKMSAKGAESDSRQDSGVDPESDNNSENISNLQSGNRSPMGPFLRVIPPEREGAKEELQEPTSQHHHTLNMDISTLTLSHMHSHHTHVHTPIEEDHFPHNHHHHHSHEHTPGGHHGHDHGLLFLDPDGTGMQAKNLSTFMLEIGVAMHSIIIGVALGVSLKDEFSSLLIALVFHQFFEGFALGARISELKFRSSLPHLLLSLLFTLTTPFGIAIGVGVSASYNPNSPAALLTQGIFDSISAGILLYMAFVNLIAVDLKEELKYGVSTAGKLKAYLAMWSGAGLMALIGRWA